MMRRLLPLAMILLLPGCASSGIRERPREKEVTRAEMMATDAVNAHEAIETLRPLWLRSRGPTSLRDPSPTYPDVYRDGVFFGSVNVLLSVHVSDVVAIRFWSPGEAGVRYGMGHPRGIIEIITVENHVRRMDRDPRP